MNWFKSVVGLGVLAALAVLGWQARETRREVTALAARLDAPPAALPPSVAPRVPGDYLLEAPDVVELRFPIGADQDVVKLLGGQMAVRPDGTIFLGPLGSVTVAAATVGQAEERVRRHLGMDGVKLRVTQFNSKRYYVITDGGGYGEQVYPFPVTGSETVLDALANINGLPSVASKRNIWVARRSPHADHPWQILPVDWIGITQHGITTTNYQIMPGDRIYVKAQRIITIDTALARLLSPVERMLGVTLLGANVNNQIKGNVGGNNAP